jgi:chromosome segregation ATPase
MKEDFSKDMENLTRKNQTEILEIKSNLNQIKSTGENHSSRLEQVEDRISGLEDKMHIKEKTEELLNKRLKSCERNTQELRNSIKTPNVQIMGIKGEEVQAKKICNIFNKIIAENFPNLELSIQVQASGAPNRVDQNRTSPQYIIGWNWRLSS